MHNSSISSTHLSMGNNSCLIGLEAHQKRVNYSWYWKPSLLPKASNSMDIRKQSIATIFPDQNNSLLHSILSLYPQLSLATTPVKEKGDTHRNSQLDTVQRLMDHGKLSPKGYSYITSLASIAQGTLGKSVRARMQGKSAGNQSLLEIRHEQYRNNHSIDGLKMQRGDFHQITSQDTEQQVTKDH